MPVRPADTRSRLLGPVFHPSGGLLYHLRAWRWRRTLWAPFHEQARRWLTDWRPTPPHLVLVGPSGGYALTRPFLERFARVTVLEPDPLARRILRRRFPATAFTWARTPWLAGPDGCTRLAHAWPDAAFLFCNLLGQDLVGESPGFDRRAWLAGLPRALSGVPWASWHDLASTGRPPDHRVPLAMTTAAPLESVLRHYWHGGELEIHDHDCAGLCPDSPRQYGIWQLTPGRWHLIEWLAHDPLAG